MFEKDYKLKYLINYSFYQKYLKYKNKYLTLKNQFSGTKDENNKYLLHGTNLFYIDDIIKNGLSGLYNQEIYDIIKKHWPTISYLARDPYVGYFIERQREIRLNDWIQLSFTGLSSVAEEYCCGARKFGEGPSRFLTTLQDYFSQNKESDNLCY